MEYSITETAKAMVAKGKGILAADESTGTIAQRLGSVGVENTEENRRAWRNLLFTTPGLERHISGVILYEEIRQKPLMAFPSPKFLSKAGIIPGVKVDRSTHPLPGSDGEVMTEWLDGLRSRLREYFAIGARFTKWRGVISISHHHPSDYCVDVNAHALARFAALSQDEGFAPIVEPEILMDGAHGIDRCLDVTERVLRKVFFHLASQRVKLEGMVLKPNMVLSGADAADRAGPEEVARATVECFLRAVPAAMPGIAFLSGGQSDEESTKNLDAINKLASKRNAPWELTFSYGRGLQATPLKVWNGRDENIASAQDAFAERCRVTAAARSGSYV